jgi:hypothetical protein
MARLIGGRVVRSASRIRSRSCRRAIGERHEHDGRDDVVPTTSPQDAATTRLVSQLRDSVLPTVPAKTHVVRATASYVDFIAKVSKRMPWLILAVVVLAFILLTVAFRSIVIATKAAVLNLLSVGAAYGVVVAIFQWGWGSSLVGIHEKLPIPAFVPMLMFAIVFGLSMDHEVFLISRVHEAWIKTADAHRSVAIGIGGTARVITTAAAIMIVVFTSFVLDPDPTVKMLAIGMAAAVLIDASVIGMILVPAVMSLLAEHAWWIPKWLDRITPNLDIEDTEHLARTARQDERGRSGRHHRARPITLGITSPRRYGRADRSVTGDSVGRLQAAWSSPEQCPRRCPQAQGSRCEPAQTASFTATRTRPGSAAGGGSARQSSSTW